MLAVRRRQQYNHRTIMFAQVLQSIKQFSSQINTDNSKMLAAYDVLQQM
jgi:hypothetical protein